MAKNDQEVVLMKLIAVIILTILFIPADSVSADVETNSVPGISAIKPGTYAIQLGLGNNFTLTSWQGMAISIKKQLSDDMVFRLGLDANWDGDKITDRNLHLGDSSRTAEENEGNYYYEFEVVTIPQYMFYLKSSTVINVYYTIGLGIGIGYRYET